MHSLLNKGSLLALMVSRRTFNIDGLSIAQSFFKLEKGSKDKNVLLRTVNWKVLWGTKMVHTKITTLASTLVDDIVGLF